MELMKQFKAQTVSSIGGFLRQLSERKDVDIQKCSFIKEMNETTGVYIVANDKEAVVLAVDARREDGEVYVDEYPYHGEEPIWSSPSCRRVSPIYLMRQVMSLLSLCYKRADLRNVEIGGALLSVSELVDVGDFKKLLDQLNICILDELGSKEDALLLREHTAEGNINQQVLSDLSNSYNLMGLPDLVHSDDYVPKNVDKSTTGEHPDFVLPNVAEADQNSEEMDSFERDLLELFGPLESVKPRNPSAEDDEGDDAGTTASDCDEEDSSIFDESGLDFDFEELGGGKEHSKKPDVEDELLDNFHKHMKMVREDLNEQYPSGPSGTCNVPSRVEILPPVASSVANAEFSQLVGIDEIRAQIESLTLMSQYNHRFASLNPDAQKHQVTLHAVFTGNPGTGKSTVCKLYGTQLRQAGVLQYGHVVVVDRSSFVGACWGDEEKNVRALLQLARGGVLMVDEAYQLLGDGHPTDPGRMVLPLMMNQLADPKWSDIAVVLCGYPRPMQKLLEQNPGLNSRFPNRFKFNDFDVETLEQITLNRIASFGYRFAPDAWAKYRWFLREAYDARDERWPNARFVASWLEQIYIRHGVRCERQQLRQNEDLCLLTSEDVTRPNTNY